MKKLILIITLISPSFSFAAKDTSDCNKSYNDVTSSITAFYKVLGGEDVSKDEVALVAKVQLLIASNKKFQGEVLKLTAFIQELAEKDIELSPENQIALLAGGYYRAVCSQE